MARYPKAKWLPVSGLERDPVIEPIGVILHVDGGNSSSLFNYFNGPSQGVESNFFLNKIGIWEQYRDSTREADAQAAGNSWTAGAKRYGYISVETQGYATGAWNNIQIKELAYFLVWAHITHDIPLVLCNTAKSPGIGYHRQFDAWNPNNHVCPGNDRVAQIPDLINLAKALVNGDVPLMGTFVEPEGKLPNDGVYYIDEQGVWPVNYPRFEFLKPTVKTIPRAQYSRLLAYANPQTGLSASSVEALLTKHFLTPEEAIVAIAQAVVKALPPAQVGGLTPADVEAALIRVLGKTQG
jgi:hypothetical protein